MLLFMFLEALWSHQIRALGDTEHVNLLLPKTAIRGPSLDEKSDSDDTFTHSLKQSSYEVLLFPKSPLYTILECQWKIIAQELIRLRLIW